MSRETKMVDEDGWIAKLTDCNVDTYDIYEQLKEVDSIMASLEEKLCDSEVGGIGYQHQYGTIQDTYDKINALGKFIQVLPEKMKEVDTEFCRKIQNGSTAKLSEIKLESFQTHKVGSLSTSYKDHGQTHSTDSINLTFKDFIGISGNENEYEEDTAWDDGKINDSYIRVFADMYKEQYEEQKKKGTADTLYEFLNGKMTAGEFIQKRQHNICLEVLQSVADLVPVVGQAKMLYEMASGKEMFTGDEMTYEEQRNNSLFFCLSLLAAPEAVASKAFKFAGGTIEDIEKVVFKEAIEKGTADIDNAEDIVKKYFKDLRENYKKITEDEIFMGGLNSYEEFNSAFKEITIRTDLSNEEKISKLQELLDKSNYKTDINVPSNVQYVKDIDANGNVIYDWPPKLGFDEKTVRPISRTDGLPDKWDRYGYMGGSNFADVPSAGKYTYSERAIPYLENEAAYHSGTFNNESYFDKIDAIKCEDCNSFNKILQNEGISSWELDDFEELCDKYDSFINNASEIFGESIDPTYGIKGGVASWGDMSGGAGQIVTPFSGDVLKKIGILKEK